jgi:hypothetical protein
MTHLTKIPNSMRLHLYAACVHVKTQGQKTEKEKIILGIFFTPFLINWWWSNKHN